MSADELKRDRDFYADVSRITLKGLAEITADFQQFYSELTSKLQPALVDMTREELPEASDQLEAIVETTEKAATRIMDMLEEMQEEQDAAYAALKKMTEYKRMARDKRDGVENALSAVDSSRDKIMHIFEELSFQDLTGQRIKRIVSLVKAVESKVKNILEALGEKVPEDAEKRPRPAKEPGELQGPQRDGEGLDQSSIDDLLSAL